MNCDFPPLNFIGNLLLDSGVSCEEVGTVLSNLLISLATYETDKSKTSLTKIADDLFNCIQPKLSADTTNLAENIGRALIWLIILTAVFILIIISVFAILKHNTTELIVGITFFFLVIYVIVAFLIIHNASLNITNNTNNLKNDITKCVKDSITALDNYETDQINALNNSLCAYPTNNKCNEPPL